MNEALQTLEVKVENNGTTPQGKIFAREWNVMVEAVKALDLKEFDEAKLLQFLRDNDFITSEDIPDVDFSNVVTLSGRQTISGAKDFVGGIKVNGMPIIYNAELGVWEFAGDLFVTGNFAWGSSIDGFKPSTVTDAVRVDGSTIIKKKDSNGDWYLYAPGGGSGGTGGGLTAAEVNLLIEKALKPYALATSIPTDNKQLENGAGYATEQWVGDNYLASSNFTKAHIKSTLGISDWALAATEPSYTAEDVGAVVYSEDIAIWNHSSYRHIGYGYRSGGWISDGPAMAFGANANYYHQLQFSNDLSSTIYHRTIVAGVQGEWAKIIDSTNIADYALPITGGTINGSITAPSFIGTLTGNADSATNADKLDNLHSWDFVLVNSRISSGSNINHIGYGYVENGNITTGPMITYGANTTYFAEIQSYAYNESLYYRIHNANGYGPVKSFAFTDSNVASATKLQTPRTIWGQSFDGTKDIDGAMFGVSFIQEDNYYVGNRDMGLGTTDGGLLLLAYENKPMSFFTNSQLQMHITADGNVVVGGTTADAKLHVHGTTILGGDTTINGNLLVNGNVSWYSLSQRSLKNIISEQGLSLAQLERIKPIKFYWKDGRDMVLHVGGVADVFAEVLPEVVARNLQDILCLNYVDAAFYVGASLIAPVLDHERRITKGEAEQEALKKENAKLKRELEEVKSKLNHLVA